MKMPHEILAISVIPCHNVLAWPNHFLQFITSAPQHGRNVDQVLMSLVSGLYLYFGVPIVKNLSLHKCAKIGTMGIMNWSSEELYLCQCTGLPLLELHMYIIPQFHKQFH